jgi:hypothetical protein
MTPNTHKNKEGEGRAQKEKKLEKKKRAALYTHIRTYTRRKLRKEKQVDYAE